MKARFIPWPVSGVLLVAGCGGGGGDPVIGGSNPPPPELVEITTANAQTVAAGAMLSALEGGNFATLAVPETPEIGVTSTKTTPLFSKVGAAQVERQASAGKESPPITSAAPVGPTSAACDFGGTVTISGDVASQGAVSPGDRLTFAFDECDDGTAVVDGTFSMTVVAFSGSLETSEFSLSVTVELDALRIVEADETVAADGDASIAIDTLSSPTLEVVVSSDSLTVEAEGLSQSLGDYSFSASIDTVTGDYSIEAWGAFSSTAFEGLAEFETVEPFVGFGSARPHVGELLISGANGATIRAIALDAQFVRLEVDTDGDGTADFIDDFTWEELTAD